jgi:phytoene dehydrogenase-like protein
VHDAIVIGAGPNGLTAANLLADAGWEVLLLEAEGEVGGARPQRQRCGARGFVHDVFSSFYPPAPERHDRSPLVTARMRCYGPHRCLEKFVSSFLGYRGVSG